MLTLHAKPDFAHQLAPAAFKWLGRIAAALLVLFWGAFFIEHLNEWYRHAPTYPPLFVSITMGMHLGMLIGLSISVRWARLGSLLTLIATAGFMVSAGVFLPILLVNLAPPVCFLLAWSLARATPSAV